MVGVGRSRDGTLNLLSSAFIVGDKGSGPEGKFVEKGLPCCRDGPPCRSQDRDFLVWKIRETNVREEGWRKEPGRGGLLTIAP